MLLAFPLRVCTAVHDLVDREVDPIDLHMALIKGAGPSFRTSSRLPLVNHNWINRISLAIHRP